MIKAEIVADSLSPQGDRLTSFLITMPRIILSEINTHRMLSKNTSSSRAIPFKKMVEAVQNDPFVPIAWQRQHSGMQGTEYITDQKVIDFKTGVWLQARNEAIKRAEELNGNLTKCRSMNDCEELEGTGVTKQLCNRLLEPFMWTTMLITGSEEGWDNFFKLRNPMYEYKGDVFNSKKDAIKSYTFEKGFIEDRKYLESLTDLEWLQINKGQAEIHLMDLAEKIYDSFNESTPRQLKAGEWHIPFEDKIHIDGIQGIQFTLKNGSTEYHEAKWITEAKVKISTAMAARTSYTIVGDEKEINYQKMIELHDRLIAQNPPHSSPMEHCARAMDNDEYNSFIKGDIHDFANRELQADIKKVSGKTFITGEVTNNELGWCRNFKGFIPYRYIVETNN